MSARTMIRISFIAERLMHEWLLLRPLIVYVLACPAVVIVALLLLRDRQRRDRKDENTAESSGLATRE
jgi:hypothetical protein